MILRGKAVSTFFFSLLFVASALQHQTQINAVSIDNGPSIDKSDQRSSCLRALSLPRKPSREWRIINGVRASTWQWSESAKQAGHIRVSVVSVQPGRALVQPIGRIPTMTDPEQVAGRSGSLAVINGDFFDTLPKGDALPQGAVIIDGKPIFMPPGWSRVVAWNSKNRLRTSHVTLKGSITSGTQTWQVDALNDPLVRGTDTAVINGDWHRSFIPDGVAAIVVHGQTVRERHSYSKNLRVPRGGYLIVARSEVGLPMLRKGDSAELQMGISTSNQQDIVHAAGHGGVALKEGRSQPICSTYESIPRPRSMLAWSEDGRYWLLTASSGLPDTSEGLRRGGMTKEELARVARQLGATTAVVLDGGGSTALFARQGTKTHRLDMPAGSWVRPIPIAWQLMAP